MGTDHNNEEISEIKCEARGECPTPAAHKRLQDAHHLWHQAAAKYGNPEEFRVNLNACIQALRSVTFVLQKEKARIPNFDLWYSGWQDKLRADPILRWLVEARNKIVKEGDLATKSTVRVAVVMSYFEPPYIEFSVHPFKPIDELIKRMVPPELPEIVRNDGLLRVERRWIAEDLPKHELLETLAHCYGVLSTLVRDAHAQAGLPDSQFYLRSEDASLEPFDTSYSHFKGRLPCMVTTVETRTVWIKLSTGEFLRPVTISEVSSISVEEIEGRYGPLPGKLSALKPKPSSIREHAEILFEFAKKVLRADGYHITMVILMLPGGKMRFMTVAPQDQSEKYVLWSNVGLKVERYGASGIIVILEAWMAQFDPGYPARSPSKSPDRVEVLQLVAASSGGEEFSLTCRFKRKDGAIEFDETIESVGPRAFYLEPVRRVWGTHRKREVGKKTLRRWKIDRNSPCPCGSGRKYKKCCSLTLNTDLKDRAYELYDEKNYEEAKRGFRAFLTQYIIWYHEHTLPMLKDDPEAAAEILMVDIEAIVSIVEGIARCLDNQEKRQEVAEFLENASDIVDDLVFKFYIASSRATWFATYNEFEQARGVLKDFSSMDITRIPMTKNGQRALRVFLDLLWAELPLPFGLSIVDNLLKNMLDPTDQIALLTQKSLMHLLDLDITNANAAIDEALSKIDDVKTTDQSEHELSLFVIADAYHAKGLISKDNKFRLKAIESYNELISFFPEDLASMAWVYQRIGQNYDSMLEPRKAKDCLISSLELNQSIVAIIDLANTLVQLDETDEALSYLGRIDAQEIPNDLMLDYLNVQAEIAAKKKDFSLAKEVYSQLSGLELSAPLWRKVRDEIRSALSEMQVGKARSRSFIKEIKRVDPPMRRIPNKIPGPKDGPERN